MLLVMKVNYPTGIKKQYQHKIQHGNRGMALEDDINDTNQYYLNHNIAVIHKKPTPITIKKVDYPSRLEAVIKEAYFKIPSTTDYNGIYKGKYIDFEAKETRHDYFPLANIHKHQIEHLKKIDVHGGIGFIIVRFSRLGETYYLGILELLSFLESSNRKSIPREYFMSHGHLLKEKYSPRLDYLTMVDKIYFEGE